MLVAGGSTDVTTYFSMRLTADGTAATGLTETDFDLQYVRSGAAPSAKVDATAGTAGGAAAHSDNTVVEPDATDQPGVYRIDWPDAAFAAGVREVILTAKVATAFTEHLRVEIDGEVNVVEWAGTDVVAGAIPAAAADAAGGLPISDAGGLDLDTQLANTNEVTAARMGALTDWINGGRLDLILDIIAADVVNIDGAAMRGTDNAALASVLGALNDAAAAGDPTASDTAMQYIKQLINILVGTTGITTFPAEAAPGNNVSLAEVIRAIHVDVTGLNGDAMRGTDSAALASVCTEARLAELDGANLPTDVAAVKSDTAAILTDTGEIGAAGAGLTNINLPNQTMDIVGNITGNLSGSVGSVTGSVGSLTGHTNQTADHTANISAIKTNTDNLPSGIKKNTGLNNFEFFMRDTTDHVTGKTGLTITSEMSQDGGAFGATANSASEVGNGVYKINLAAADLNADVVTFKFTSAGADATIITIKTEP
jgi:hypothetical protein